jgi:hypothetical protein
MIELSSINKVISSYEANGCTQISQIQKRPRGCRTVDGPCLLEERKKILGVFNSTALNLGKKLFVYEKQCIFILLSKKEPRLSSFVVRL